MSLTSVATRAVERTPLPDSLTLMGVGYLVARARRQLALGPADGDAAFAAAMALRPIAENTAEANAQHYEVPADFFRRALGPRLKYSSCFYESPTATLAQAEEAALAQTCAHADLADGQRVLELGCGWGSLSLWMAEHYPLSSITAVSNSKSQREFIQAKAKVRGLTNLCVITRDMNEFTPPSTYDRIVSVEMFEHMANWRALFARLIPALEPDGRLFLHVFTHRDRAYRFESSDPDDFIAQHFFTGGIMPSHTLIRQFPDLVEVEEEWRWSGEHYRRTAMDWLANFDHEGADIAALFKRVYGADAALWKRRWRLFFLAVAGLFGDSGGDVWGVSHYRLRPVAQG
jgi:cyclopropane-fatty-acyl-phospholipid synthase